VQREVGAELRSALARELDDVQTIERALGSVDEIVSPGLLRASIISALIRDEAVTTGPDSNCP
jgi:hypothetical protein